MADDEGTEAPGEKPDPKDDEDGFKSEESKERVLADLAKERSERKKLAARLQEIEDRDKSDLQKAVERAEAAERKASENELLALKAGIAAEKGVLASALSGTSKEDLEKSADALIAWRDSKKPPPPEPRKLKSGASGGGEDDGRGRAAAALRQLRGAGN